MSGQNGFLTKFLALAFDFYVAGETKGTMFSLGRSFFALNLFCPFGLLEGGVCLFRIASMVGLSGIAGKVGVSYHFERNLERF